MSFVMEWLGLCCGHTSVAIRVQVLSWIDKCRGIFDCLIAYANSVSSCYSQECFESYYYAVCTWTAAPTLAVDTAALRRSAELHMPSVNIDPHQLSHRRQPLKPRPRPRRQTGADAECRCSGWLIDRPVIIIIVVVVVVVYTSSPHCRPSDGPLHGVISLPAILALGIKRRNRYRTDRTD